MDFDEAIKAHAAWKIKLTTYLAKPDGSLKAGDVAVDHKCALGQWIHGEGAHYAKLEEYATLKSEHARFHKAAAEVIKKADSGQNTSADTALGGTSEFATASTNVVSAIMKMKVKASKAA